MRKRMIDPTIWQDENFGKLSPRSRILFIGLFSNADDDGYLRGNDSVIRSMIFPYDDIPLVDVRQMVGEVQRIMKNVHLYVVDDNQYIHLLKWEDYQIQREDRRQKTKLPQCNICFPKAKKDNVSQMTDKRPSDVSQMTAEVKLSKLSKVKLSKYSTPKEITKEVIQEIADEYKVNFGFVNLQFEKLKNYCDSKGKTYKNYKAALRNFVLGDMQKELQRSKKGGVVDGTNL